jgi:hypothetical protein
VTEAKHNHSMGLLTLPGRFRPKQKKQGKLKKTLFFIFWGAPFSLAEITRKNSAA